jgi:hypothetical protein
MTPNDPGIYVSGPTRKKNKGSIGVQGLAPVQYYLFEIPMCDKNYSRLLYGTLPKPLRIL